MLVFQVDLFPARGERPHDLEQAWSREKDIRYSSRTRRISDGLVRRRKEHRLIDRMLAKLPEEFADLAEVRSEEHTSELQSLMRISYAVFCLKKKNKPKIVQHPILLIKKTDT